MMMTTMKIITMITTMTITLKMLVVILIIGVKTTLMTMGDFNGENIHDEDGNNGD